jgi:uncharacterized protein (DUF2126 family)
MRVAITHRIDQHFARSRSLSTHWLRLRPAPEQRARITAFSLAVQAEPHFLNWVRDPFENHLGRLDFPEPLAGFGITLELIAELAPTNPFDFLTEPYAAGHPFEYPTQLKKELSPYLLTGEPGPRLGAWLADLDRTSTTTVERLAAVNRMVQEAHALTIEGAPDAMDVEGFLEREKGSCWDFAWLLTVTLRHLGIAARFACGYRVLLADEADGSTPRLPDTVTLHTWSEAYIPGAGWIGLDPSMGTFVTESHIPLACAPDPLHVLPIVGDRETPPETRSESLRARRLTPSRVSWPHTDTQWADIEALGRYLDEDLAIQGLRPTVGVSLSLVSGLDAMRPEWSTQALGPSKRSLAESLSLSLRERLGPGGVLQLGQGEWFGGETLPRWRLGCFFRADGEPVWRNPERLSSGQAQGTASADQAERLAQALARGLGIDPARAVAAYEDPLHELWRAHASGASPHWEDLRDPMRRRALAERLSSAHRTPTGYVLPLSWDHARACWVSGAWRFRRAELFLAPGSASMGYRLPLNSLIDDEAGVFEAEIERSPLEERGRLPDFHAGVRARHERGVTEASARDDHPPRTALCVEARAGRLFVFLPPVSHLEHYLDLVAVVEVAAEALKLPLSLEGYPPPEDPRLRRVLLEPDAGVLRLDLPETDNWDQLLRGLSAAYEEAWALGLGTERVAADDGGPGAGRRLPSGGGGRLTIGGVSPSESPFLTRPEILRSLVAYWQRHPCLSYLFAGRLIGPSGSAPRPDEGRDELLYELSIALERLPSGTSDKPWLPDRMLRHLLTDPAGNLKRAEIRVDELYSPERASARLGRIMINAFESAPEMRLGALQSLLVLGLIGRFGRHPDSGELRRWGPALHDRFMLPDVLLDDLRTVVADLGAARYPFQLDWFQPLFELRFPLLGSVPIGPLTLKLRTAHEPWPLLAEEATGGGLARFIDASTERLQTTLSGAHPGRYVLACNGHRVPLQETATHGEYVAGVRYKASNPPATLHPTVWPVQALVFDVIDTWTGRGIGGCTYLPPQPEIWGPIGTAAEAPPTGEPRAAPRVFPVPILSMQAMGKSGRFSPRGSGLGPMTAPPKIDDEQFPHLLDLTNRA